MKRTFVVSNGCRVPVSAPSPSPVPNCVVHGDEGRGPKDEILSHWWGNRMVWWVQTGLCKPLGGFIRIRKMGRNLGGERGRINQTDLIVIENPKQQYPFRGVGSLFLERGISTVRQSTLRREEIAMSLSVVCWHCHRN